MGGRPSDTVPVTSGKILNFPGVKYREEAASDEIVQLVANALVFEVKHNCRLLTDEKLVSVIGPDWKRRVADVMISAFLRHREKCKNFDNVKKWP